MNIFYLHSSAPIAASYHCDKHVGKMLIESCQMLATAHHLLGNGHNVTYRPTHANHPSSVWVRESRLQYMFVAELARYLGIEFRKRYGKDHKSLEVLKRELLVPPPAMYNMPARWTNPPLAMPDEYKSDDTVESYRRFYVSKQERMPMVYYKGERTQPWFFNLDMVDAA